MHLGCYCYYFELTLQRAKCAIPRATSTAIDVFICSVKPLVVLFPSCCRDCFKKSNRQPFSASSIITSRRSGDREMNGMRPMDLSKLVSNVKGTNLQNFQYFGYDMENYVPYKEIQQMLGWLDEKQENGRKERG